MRRLILLCGFAIAATLVISGVALAVNKTCPSDCRGTSGDDRLLGSARANTIYAESGDDRVLGRGGEDQLKGGDGRDEVYGQEANDRVKGSEGSDQVFGGPGDDLVRGGTVERPNDGARDVLDCGDGTDTVYFIPDQDVARDCEVFNPPE